jgi:C_GCAxxG_C_C family probable redox protein
MKKSAGEYFSEGYNCAQSVLMSLAEELGMDISLGASVSAAFGAGICHRQEICGAVSGALMVLGKRFFDPKQPVLSKALIYEKGREFIEEFERVNGSSNCLSLIDVDFSQPGAMERARNEGVFTLVCKKLVESAAGILEEARFTTAAAR